MAVGECQTTNRVDYDDVSRDAYNARLFAAALLTLVVFVCCLFCFVSRRGLGRER